MEALSRQELGVGSEPRRAGRRRLNHRPRLALSEGYPPAPPLAERSRLATLTDPPRHLLGSLAIALFELNPAVRRVSPRVQL
jgi:hypothetical protein